MESIANLPQQIIEQLESNEDFKKFYEKLDFNGKVLFNTRLAMNLVSNRKKKAIKEIFQFTTKEYNAEYNPKEMEVIE